MKNKQHFETTDELKFVVGIINESAVAVNDKSRDILNSPLSDVLIAGLGYAGGAGISGSLLYFLGTRGFSAPGITSALKRIGFGSMKRGVIFIALPAVILMTGGTLIARKVRANKVYEEKQRLIKIAIERLHSIVETQKSEFNAAKQRMDYLNSLNIMLTKIIEELQEDIAQGVG